MYSSIPISPANGGQPVATDLVGGVHRQVMKVAFGEEGVAQPVSPDNPMPVTTSSRLIDVVLSLDTAAYADGDVLADTQVVAGALRIPDGRGLLNSVVVVDTNEQSLAIDLVFLSADVALGTENAPPSMSASGAAAALGVVRVLATDYVDLGNARVATVAGLTLGLKAATGTADIYVGAIIRGAGTYTAAGVRLRLNIITD